jgi:FdhD protein
VADARTIVRIPVHRVVGTTFSVQQDEVAAEEPLQIRISYFFKGQQLARDISITMRTPGKDAELAAGFLYTEGIIRKRADITELRLAGTESNEVHVELADDVDVDMHRLQRNFYATSSCGVCGKTSLSALELMSPPEVVADRPEFRASIIHKLPGALLGEQAVFTRTGGLHASALFTPDGDVVALQEDVGRHNALDKLIGSAFLRGELPLSDRLLLLSGRTSFELIQKARMAGIGAVVAVGAPSSLAVQLAQEHQMTLVGFVRDGHFNIYSGAWRIRRD